MRNGKSIIVRVTDRGPHRKGRVIDLSYGAARELGMLSQGIAMVEIERVDKTRVPYRDDPEMGMPEFEFDFSKLTLPPLPNEPILHNRPIMPTMHNRHIMPNRPKDPNRPKEPATPSRTQSPITNH